MESHAQEKEKLVTEGDPELSSAVARIVENACRQLEEEFNSWMESAVRGAEKLSLTEIEAVREQAVADAREQLSAELRGQFDQTLQENNARMQAEFEERLDTAQKEWEAERGGIQVQVDMWRAYA